MEFGILEAFLALWRAFPRHFTRKWAVFGGLFHAFCGFLPAFIGDLCGLERASAIYVASSVHRRSMWPRACIGDLCGLERASAIYVASSVHRRSMWPRVCIGNLCGLERASAIYVASSVHRQSMWPRACIGDLCGLPRIWSGNSNVSCGPGDPPRHAEINDPRSNKVGIVMVRSCQGGEGGRGGFPSPSLLLRLLLSLNKIKHSSRLPSVWC